MVYKLIMQSGPTAGTSYELDQNELFLGRDLSNDIVINDPEISRRHARLYMRGTAYVIEDLGSTNGTVVNGQRLRGPSVLNHGDHILLGQNVSAKFESDMPLGDSDQTLVSDVKDTAETMASGMPIPAAHYQSEIPQPEIPEEFAKVPESGLPRASESDFGVPQQPRYQQQSIPRSSQQMSSSTGQPSKKKKIPVWLMILLILLVITCACVSGLFVIDRLNLWCDLMPFLPGCPVI